MFQPILTEELESRIGKLPFGKRTQAKIIVSLRDIDPKNIASVEIIPREYLERLIRGVTLEGNSSIRPYANCEIITARIDPYELEIGQTFIQREKYRQILEDFGNILDSGFCVTRGIAKRSPFIIFGLTRDGRPAAAHYLPPLIEENNGIRFLLDGIHRNFLVKNIGTTIESIIIKGVKTELPCDPRPWNTIRAVEKKPPREERYFNLRADLFRNLKHTGIDG